MSALRGLNGMCVPEVAEHLTDLNAKGCTGYLHAVPNGIFIHHDSHESCPVHETGEPDPLQPADPIE